MSTRRLLRRDSRAWQSADIGFASTMSMLWGVGLWLILSSARAVSAEGTTSPEDAAFLPGTIPLDTDGNQVHAHGGGILRVKDVWYWYGTTQKRPPGWLSEGVNLYASEDLTSWKYQGQIYKTADSRGMPCSVPYRLERPKVLHLVICSYRTAASTLLLTPRMPAAWPYGLPTRTQPCAALQHTCVQILFSAATQQYVMLFHLDTPGFQYPAVGVARSAKITGPFTFVCLC